MGGVAHSGRLDRRTARRRTGDLAEEAVARLLSSLGWAIVARNVRVGRGEVDIIGIEPTSPATAVFVEVRSATVPGFGAPEESVDAAKVRRLYRAAWRLVQEGVLPDGQPLPQGPWRVDLVTVVRDEGAGHWLVTRHLRGLMPP